MKKAILEKTTPVKRARPRRVRLEDQYDGIVAEAHKMQDAVGAYIDRGWSPIPIMLKTAKGKGGGFAEWQRIKVTRNNLKRYFPNVEPRNIGILLGKPSAGLTDIDLDCPEAIRLAARFLPHTEAIFGRTGKKYSHYLYRTNLWESATVVAVVFKEIHKADPKLTRTLVELRTGRQNEDGTSAGSQTVVPPSWHKDDERVRWHVEGEPAAVDGSDLKRSSLKLAVATLLVRNYPGETQRHNCALAIGGLLARAGWSAEDIEQTVLAAAEGAGDEEAAERATSAAAATTLADKDKHPPGINKVREHLGDVVADSLADWLKLKLAKQADDDDVSPTTQTGKLIQHCRDNAELFHTADGTAYADVEVDGHRETWAVQSDKFKGMLQYSYYKATSGGVPNPESLKTAIAMIEAAARYDGPEQQVALRYANVEGKLYVDLCDEEWRAVEISADGWKVIDKPQVRFIRNAQMLPLPVPQRGGNIDLLRRHLNLHRDGGTDYNFILTVMFILKAMMKDFGPYPILALIGEFGSTKTSFLTALIRLIDPNETTLRGPPQNEKEMHIAAQNRHMLVYDNLSAIPQLLSDSLCRISTGIAYGTREYFTTMDERAVKTKLPQMISSIKAVILSPDAADRSVRIEPPPVSEENRCTEDEFLENVDRDRPMILGALYDMLTHGLRELPRIKELSRARKLRLPRMANFAMLGMACETAYWPQGTFMAAYARNRSEVGQEVLGADVVVSALRDFLDGRDEPQSPWTGSATQLLRAISQEVSQAQRSEKGWPKTAAILSATLKGARPFLQPAGISVDLNRSGRKGRNITITRGDAVTQGDAGIVTPNSLIIKDSDAVTQERPPKLRENLSGGPRQGQPRKRFVYQPRTYEQMMKLAKPRWQQ